MCYIIPSSLGKYRRSPSRQEFSGAIVREQSKGIYSAIVGEDLQHNQGPHHKYHLLAIYIIFHLPLVFLSPTSQKFVVLFASLFSFTVFLPDLFLSAILFALMDNSSSIACTPEDEVLNFKQREGENLKDAWYRICNAHNRSIRKQSMLFFFVVFMWA